VPSSKDAFLLGCNSASMTLTSSRPQILVVEDDVDLRDLMQITLESLGYAVELAENGAVALRLVQRNECLRLILLDMRMPVMDGWQFARAYRDLPKPHAPIVVVTAAADAAAWARDIQAVGCLGKPFELADLLAQVQHFVG
jgi:two-component system, chemotaxis family, chemotaxis protein CheY